MYNGDAARALRGIVGECLNNETALMNATTLHALAHENSFVANKKLLGDLVKNTDLNFVPHEFVAPHIFKL